MSLIVDFNYHDKNRENRAKIEDDTLNSFDEMNTIRIITCSILVSKYDTRCLLCGDYRKVLKITSTKIYLGQIQTTFTYANAEVTFSVVKLPEYPFSPPNYCLLFFCRSKRLESLRPRVCRGYSAEAVERLCMPAMR